MEFDKVYVNWIGDDEAFLLLRSAGFKGARRMQEGNKAYKPSMWTREDDWPSIVFEVDVCETMAQLQTTAWLQQDAQFWLDFFRGETRIVIIICVNQNARSMEIQKWQAEVYSNFRKKMKSPSSMRNGRFHTPKYRGKLQKMGVLYTHSSKMLGPSS